MVHYKTELMLEFPGFVLFDPVVLQEFVLEKGIEDDDLLKYFINNPTIGEESIQRGILLPMIMSWDYESNYSDFANEKSLNPQPAVEGVELNGDTGDRFDIPAGNYGVKVLGFLDVNEPDIFESKCGYELFFEKMDTLPIIPENINVDKLDYKVKVISER